MEPIGKRIGVKWYIHTDQIASLPIALQSAISFAADTVNRHDARGFNVVRVDDNGSEFAFLNYPGLGKEPFPTLESSWRLDVSTSHVSYRSYRDSLNPPILHRTELFLQDGDATKSRCILLTQQCEQVGLFDNPAIIGFQRQWFDLIRQKGYELHGYDLRPLGNVDNGFSGPDRGGIEYRRKCPSLWPNRISGLACYESYPGPFPSVSGVVFLTFGVYHRPP
jgi:DNA phosphorothioation-associated putative methyltransferase